MATTGGAPRTTTPPIARHPRVTAVAVAMGVVVLAATVPLLTQRLTSWGHGQALPSPGTRVVHLASGPQLVYEDCSQGGIACPNLAANEVSVTELATGSRVAVALDRSEDRDLFSPWGNDVTAGAVAFTTPRSGRYRIAVTGAQGRRLLVTLSPGAMLEGQAGWLTLAGLALVAVLGGLVVLLATRAIRRRQRRTAGAAPILGPHPGRNPRIVS